MIYLILNDSDSSQRATEDRLQFSTISLILFYNRYSKYAINEKQLYNSVMILVLSDSIF